VDIVNVEAAAAWNGAEGEQWAADADRMDQVARRHHEALVDAGAISPADRVLDVGCGNGPTSMLAARLARSGMVLGLDLSEPMLAVARRRAAAAGLTNLEFGQADVQVHPFEPDSFDIVISSFGGMFFNDPVAAYRNLASGLRSGGRLRMLAWRQLAENDWLMAMRGAMALGRELPMPPPGAPTPFALADPDRTRSILEESGFVDVGFEEENALMEAGDDPDHAFALARNIGPVRGLLEGLDERQREEALANLHQLMVDRATDDGVRLPSAAWLVTATRA
jgi:SAM-dependent methyltransferase